MQIRIWTCFNNILKIYINIIFRKRYFGVKYVILVKNLRKIEMKKNSVIDGKIFIILAVNGKEYLTNNSWMS